MVDVMAIRARARAHQQASSDALAGQAVTHARCGVPCVLRELRACHHGSLYVHTLGTL